MDQPQRTPQDNADERSDLTTSAAPGGPGQTEQEPARARRSGSRTSARSDSDIRSELDALLARADDFDPNQVELLVESGIVVMLGRVPDHAAKRRLESICGQVRGVREIHDQLQVEGETLSATSDGLRMEPPRAGFRGPES